MAIADTAKLVVDLSLKGNFAAQLKSSERALTGFGSRITDVQGRAYRAGQQIGTGIRRAALIGVTAVGALIPLLVRIAKEGQDAANVETIFAKAVSNSGRVSLANVSALRAQEAALLALGGVDDELIKTEQTRLIQMGLTGAQVLRLTPLILDFSKATGIDLLTATKLAGKAVQGNVGALSRYGVQIDKTKAKLDPFGATVDALNHKFGGTTAALSGSLTNKLAVLRERLANVREEAGLRLLPVMTRLVDIVGSRIVPAFGAFLDRILPKAIAGLNKLGDALESGAGSQTVSRIVDTIQAVLPAIEQGARITGQVIATAVHLFESLPPEIQSLAIAGLAINKLTGGLVTNLAGGIIGAILGKLRSAIVNVQGAVVNVNGVPGAAPAAAAAKGGLGLVGAAVALLGVAAVEVAIAGAAHDVLKSMGVDLGKGVQAGPVKIGGPTEAQKVRDESTPRIVEAIKNGAIVTVGGFDRRITAFGGKLADDLAGVKNLPRAVAAEFKFAVQSLEKARKPQDVAAAIKRVIGEVIGKAHGDARNTERILRDLKTQLRHTHDPKLAAALRTAIHKVEAKLPGRHLAAQSLDRLKAILADGKITTKEMREIKGIERALKDHGLPHAAAQIQHTVEVAKRAQVIASKLAGHEAAAAIRDKDLSVKVTVPVNLSIRNFSNASRTIVNFGNHVSGG